MNDVDLHCHLIGQQGGRRSLNTPALVIDRDALQRNINAMAAFAKANNLVLRPHAKTHKSVEIAKLQIAAGAVGVCCAKLGEAEALAEGGIDSILLTSPVVTAPAIERLVRLGARVSDLRVTVDNLENVAALSAAFARAERSLGVLVDIDPGFQRTGVASGEDAVQLAFAISTAPHLIYVGIQFYCGREQHIASHAERRAAIVKKFDYLNRVIAQLGYTGLAPRIITGGGTGTHRIDAELGVLTELQAGSYVFMDRQYNETDLTTGGGHSFETAMMIDTRVVSANTLGIATIDAGIKSMATDGGLPVIASGAPPGAAYRFMGDEHGGIVSPETRFSIGDRLSLIAPHCDPTVNLYDHFHVVSGDTLVDIWPVQGRGRSR